MGLESPIGTGPDIGPVKVKPGWLPAGAGADDATVVVGAGAGTLDEGAALKVVVAAGAELVGAPVA